MRKKSNNRSFYLVSLLVVGLAFPGCKKKEEAPPLPPPKPAAKAPLSPVQNQSTSAKAQGVAVQPLDFSTKKDPFKTYMPESVASQPKVRHAEVMRSEDLLPIQRYDVTKFRVTGVIAGLKENTALLVDPEGRGYVVREGMLIGNNDGRISRITPSAVEVVERYRDDNGHTRKRTIMLTLPKKK